MAGKREGDWRETRSDNHHLHRFIGSVSSLVSWWVWAFGCWAEWAAYIKWWPPATTLDRSTSRVSVKCHEGECVTYTKWWVLSMTFSGYAGRVSIGCDEGELRVSWGWVEGESRVSKAAFDKADWRCSPWRIWVLILLLSNSLRTIYISYISRIRITYIFIISI